MRYTATTSTGGSSTTSRRVEAVEWLRGALASAEDGATAELRDDAGSVLARYRVERGVARLDERTSPVRRPARPRATLDLEHPLRSLRELAGVTGLAAAAARGVARPSQHQAEAQGDRIQLATLVQAAEALGYRLELAAVPVGQRDGQGARSVSVATDVLPRSSAR